MRSSFQNPMKSRRRGKGPLQSGTRRVSTWDDRSVHCVCPSSWTVTDFTPDRMTFLATSTPRPLRPEIRTLAPPRRCIASRPSTYLQGMGDGMYCSTTTLHTQYIYYTIINWYKYMSVNTQMSVEIKSGICQLVVNTEQTLDSMYIELNMHKTECL